MKFEEFVEKVKNEIKNYLPAEYQKSDVQITEVLKTNDTKMTGMTIRTESDEVVPTMYLQDYYREYEKNGKSMDEILEKMAAVYVAAKENDITQDARGLIDKITDYESIRGQILPRLINKEANAARLTEMPYKEMGDDFAVSFHIAIGNDKASASEMTIAISTALFEKYVEEYGISIDDLYNQSIRNMQEITPPTLENISDVLAGLMIDGYVEMSFSQKQIARRQLELPDEGDFYVLSNTSKLFGAASILDPKFVQEIKDKLGCNDLIFIPSSVHELLVLPKRPEMKMIDIQNMIGEVNESCVDEQEKLGSYPLELRGNELVRATDEPEKSFCCQFENGVCLLVEPGGMGYNCSFYDNSGNIISSSSIEANDVQEATDKALHDYDLSTDTAGCCEIPVDLFKTKIQAIQQGLGGDAI